MFDTIQEHFEFDSNQQSNYVRVRGRLKSNINFWRFIGASRWVLNIIEYGYFLPLISTPERAFFSNHKNALENYDFVETAIAELLICGSVEEVFNPCDVTIFNPLGVVPKKGGKLRLILDLRYLNKHLFVNKFKYEDIKVVAQIIQKGDWFFVFDLKNGYHHIDIAEEHKHYLGFSFVIKNTLRYFVFASLPFGLCTAPYVFTKLLRPLVKFWRGKANKTVLYLDDGLGAADSQSTCVILASHVRSDLHNSGLLVNKEKIDFIPKQVWEFLGYIINLCEGLFLVPDRKVAELMDLLSSVLEN